METNNKKTDFEGAFKQFKKLDEGDFYSIGAMLKCHHCNKEFCIDNDYMGIVTCPYCGEYVEG